MGNESPDRQTLEYADTLASILQEIGDPKEIQAFYEAEQRYPDFGSASDILGAALSLENLLERGVQAVEQEDDILEASEPDREGVTQPDPVKLITETEKIRKLTIKEEAQR